MNIVVGKKLNRKNVCKEMVPIALIALLLASLFFGLMKLEVWMFFAMLVIFFLLLCVAMLPGAFKQYWCISEEEVILLSDTDINIMKVLKALFQNKSIDAYRTLKKQDIDKIEIRYIKNTISGPAKRTPDTFYFHLYSTYGKKRFDLTNLSEKEVDDILHMLPALCEHIVDEQQVLYAIEHHLNLYDFIYQNKV